MDAWPVAEPGVCFGETLLADADGDGDLDILISGASSSGFIETHLLRNTLNPTDIAPSSPTGLTVTTNLVGDVLFSWMPASDDHTPAAALTYNVQVGTAPGVGDILSPDSLPSGLRMIPTRGNAGSRENLELKMLHPGTYYWSVQAMDAAFHGGPFSTNQSFTISQPMSALEAWRYTHFQTVTNAGDAADSADPDNDGQINLAEFYSNGNPNSGPARRPFARWSLDGCCLTYTQSFQAIGTISEILEWTHSLMTGPWNPLVSFEKTIIDSNDEEMTIRVCLPMPGNEPVYIRHEIRSP